MDEKSNSKDDVFSFKTRDPQEQGDDSRYLPRWKVRNRVKYTRDNDFVIDECKTDNLSCSGACLKLDRLLMPGQKLNMKIYLDKKKAVEIGGHVVWNKIAKEDHFAGISFDTASKDIQQEILNYAFEINRGGLVDHWFSGWDEDSQDQDEPSE